MSTWSKDAHQEKKCTSKEIINDEPDGAGRSPPSFVDRHRIVHDAIRPQLDRQRLTTGKMHVTFGRLRDRCEEGTAKSQISKQLTVYRRHPVL